MLDRLKQLINRHSLLSSHLIDAADNTPSSAAYRSRFGSLLRAYELAGYEPERDYRYVEVNRNLRAPLSRVGRGCDAPAGRDCATVTQDTTSDLLLINGEFSATMVLSRCRQTPAGSLRWLIQINERVRRLILRFWFAWTPRTNGPLTITSCRSWTLRPRGCSSVRPMGCIWTRTNSTRF